MTDPDEHVPYRVEAEADRFVVVDCEGNAILSCSTPTNADQYAALMNQAYRRGYKTGFRNARRPS